MIQTLTALQEDYEAIHDLRPPGPARVIVTGEVQVPSTGWSAELVKRVPRKRRKETLFLELVLTPPTEPTEPTEVSAPVITTLPVEYVELVEPVEQTDESYMAVTLLPSLITRTIQNVY